MTLTYLSAHVVVKDTHSKNNVSWAKRFASNMRYRFNDSLLVYEGKLNVKNI